MPSSAKTLLALATCGAASLIPAASASAVDPEAALRPATGAASALTWGATTSAQQLAAGQSDAATQTLVGTAVSTAFAAPLGVVFSIGPALGPNAT
jgi:hypothetical protein